MSAFQPGEWSAARILLALASVAFLLKTQPWAVIPRLTSRGVPPADLSRVRLVRRRVIWLAAGLLATVVAGMVTAGFPDEPVVKWSLFGVAVAALIEALKATLDLRRSPPQRRQGDRDAADA